MQVKTEIISKGELVDADQGFKGLDTTLKLSSPSPNTRPFIPDGDIEATLG